MIPLSLDEILKASNGAVIQGSASENIIINNITTDSRKITENSLFVPIIGEVFDGHDFIMSSFEKGAVCALSSKENIYENEKTVIKVEDTKKAFRDIAEYYIQKNKLPVVAITGSVGKTTTKDIIASVISQKYNVLKTEGNFNNEIGLPITAFKLEKENEAIVFEMGMNSFGEIHNLSKIAKPDIAVITNIGVSHIENLGSREGILKAKCEIFDYISKNGTAVLNSDDDMLITLENMLKTDIIWFGLKNKRDIFAKNIENQGLSGTNCTIVTKNGEIDVKINVPGEHMVLNALAATAVGIKMGLSNEEIKKGIENFLPSKMRMSIIKAGNGISIINDTYNANPISMKAAIDVLASESGSKVCVMGDMFELGDFAEKMHYDVGKYAAEKKIDRIICIGEFSKNTYKGAVDYGHKNTFYFKTQKEFMESNLNEYIKTGDIVLVKASRGMGLEKTVEKIQEVD